jgi:urease accessory protein
LGSPAVRITEADFLIPPEFLHLKLAGSKGQVGGLRLELQHVDGKTRLGQCYQQIPLRVLPPFSFSNEPAALLYLINPTAGLMDGDGQLVDLIARAGTRTVVTGQSANRVHPALESYATQQWRVRVEDGAELVVLPGPTIPFRGARYYQRTNIDLALSARMIWGDIWLPGRYSQENDPEVFAHQRLVQHIEVRRDGNLVFRERFDWPGPWNDRARNWHVGGNIACGSLFVTGAVLESPTLPAAEVSEASPVQRIVLPLASGDTCLRWCGTPSEVVRDLVQTALRQATRWSGGSESAPWLLGSHNFGPNHWFSV